MMEIAEIYCCKFVILMFPSIEPLKHLREIISAITFVVLTARPRGFPVGLPFVWDEATLRNATILTLQTDIGEIDLLAEVAGMGDFDAVMGHSMTVEAFHRQIVTLDLPAGIVTEVGSVR